LALRSSWRGAYSSFRAAARRLAAAVDAVVVADLAEEVGAVTDAHALKLLGKVLDRELGEDRLELWLLVQERDEFVAERTRAPSMSSR